MKIQSFSVLAALAAVLFGCTKPETVSAPDTPDMDSIIDYREAWVGDYLGMRTTSSWTIDGPTTSNTFADTVVVYIDADSNFYVDQTFVPIDSNGTFFGHMGGSNYYNITFYGPDSLNQSSGAGGLGGGTTSSFRGVKQ